MQVLVAERNEMDVPPPRNDDGLFLLINNINEQVKRIGEAQDQLRGYLFTQISELNTKVVRRDEYHDSINAIRREVTELSHTIDQLEDGLTKKIDDVNKAAQEQQASNYKNVIRVQTAILGFIAATVVTIAIKFFFHV